MTKEEMLKFLGVKTQSKESIDLCYMMDMKAFDIMNDPSLKNDKMIYTCVYAYLLDELGYKELDSESKKNVVSVLKDMKVEEEKDFEKRNQLFSGLDRVLLKYNRFDLIEINDTLSVEAKEYLNNLK